MKGKQEVAWQHLGLLILSFVVKKETLRFFILLVSVFLLYRWLFKINNTYMGCVKIILSLSFCYLKILVFFFFKFACGTCVVVREQLMGLSSCRFQACNSGPQAWQQVPLPSGLPHWPLTVLFKALLCFVVECICL